MINRGLHPTHTCRLGVIDVRCASPRSTQHATHPRQGHQGQVQPVFVDGTGTYSVGTLTTHIFYNLDLDSGTAQHGGVHAGNKCYAIAQGPDGKTIDTPWMACTRGGDAPQLGRTIEALGGGRPAEAAAGDPARFVELRR
ncbi:MAG: hypothetical protein AB1Z98_36675 [Nannocystaceae bacterium]